MLVIGLKFLAGRYHATPWGRHVNEADIAWPPDPWRLTRALIATWHRKLDHGRFPRARLERLLGALAQSQPVYWLPPAVHTHVRHYMPVREGGKDKKTLVFDAFARVSSDEEMIAAWRDMTLDGQNTEMLDALLDVLGYVGRAESWVEARRIVSWNGTPNCVPGNVTVDQQTGEVLGETVRLFHPLSGPEYAQFLALELEKLSQRKLKKKDESTIKATLPQNWLDAISLDTGDLQKAGWSQPPAACRVNYLRPVDSLRPTAPTVRRRIAQLERARLTTARYALYGKPLPRIEDAVRIGECMRTALMKIAGSADIPAVLCGHDMPEGNRHEHAFYLPEDSDGDGRIDHVVVHASGGLGSSSRRILDRLTRLWNREGSEWQVLLENITDVGLMTPGTDCRLLSKATVWESVTPYLHPWYAKKKFTVEDQLRRECRERGLPEIECMERLPTIPVGGRERRPVHFHRFRTKRGLRQPDTHGSFWRIHFAKPLHGPLALGFACHFGLGMFTASEDEVR